MSAETCLEVCAIGRRLAIVVARGGDTIDYWQGQIRLIVGTYGTYAECAEAFARVSDPCSPGYVWTEHGGEMPSEEEIADRAMTLFLRTERLTRSQRRRLGRMVRSRPAGG